MTETENDLKGALEQILAPMVGSDEGELFLVKESKDQVHLHLRGRFAGCPGNGLVLAQVVTPLIHSVRPGVRVELTSGPILPKSAVAIQANPISLTDKPGTDTSKPKNEPAHT